MEGQIQNIPAPPQIGAPVSIIEQPVVTQLTGVKKLDVKHLGKLQVFQFFCVFGSLIIIRCFSNCKCIIAQNIRAKTISFINFINQRGRLSKVIKTQLLLLL